MANGQRVDGEQDAPENTAGHASRANSKEQERMSSRESNNGNKEGQAKTEGEHKKDSLFKKLLGKLDLDIGTVMMMFKGSIPPTVALAFYQAPAVASVYSTLGYLVPIISVLSMCIMPRAKFIQTMIFNLIGICVGSAVALLGIWSAIKAREHTTPAGTITAYNSSQSAVCAIWLFANIYFVNVMRAKIPALNLPVIIFSIFTNVAFTYGPIFTTFAQGEALIKRLLEGFLTAFGIATVTNFFVIPVTSRTVVMKEITGYIRLVQGLLKAQSAYLESLETSAMFTGTGSDGKSLRPSDAPEAKKLTASMSALNVLHGKLYGDLPFAKRELAWGKLDAKDLDEIFVLFRKIMIPLNGMSTIVDIFERVAERRGWIRTENSEKPRFEDNYDKDTPEKRAEAAQTEQAIWNEVMKTLHEPFSVASSAMLEGLEHAGIVLGFFPRPKKANDGNDVEKSATNTSPGEEGFSDHLERKMLEFYSKRGATLRAWAAAKGLSTDIFEPGHETPKQAPPSLDPETVRQHRRDQSQLYLVLYMEHLLYSTGMAIASFVKFADSKVKDGTMKKNRIIAPGVRRLKKWLLSITKEDSTVDSNTPDSMEAGQNIIYTGAFFNRKRVDPEHLPPKNAYERFGNAVRAIPRFLGSTESAFGFRVACATMTIGIVAFLEQTHTFFMEQRLVWAMIIIAIGMTITSGQSTFGFFGRIAGTALAMVFSFIIWYIVDEKTPGVIVMVWFFIFLEYYLFLKFPRFIAIWLVCIVTQVLIIGYELQVRVIGIAVATASGQAYYPIYELGPYRLACVAGGSFVAFIWTIFPYPLTDRSWLRKDLGSTIYLLANYYSVNHSTIKARIRGEEGDMSSKTSPGRQLEKARRKIFGKLLILIPSLRQHSDWQKWEIAVGGKYPRETYEGIINRLTNMTRYLSLMSYATETWSKNFPNSRASIKRTWLNDLSKLLDGIAPTSHRLTSTLCLVSASVIQGTALPPYIQLPELHALDKVLEGLDSGILDSKHVEEPGYSAYAVLQVTSNLLRDDLDRLVSLVRDLVGEVDFSFKVVGSEEKLSNDEEISSATDQGVNDNGHTDGKAGKHD